MAIQEWMKEGQGNLKRESAEWKAKGTKKGCGLERWRFKMIGGRKTRVTRRGEALSGRPKGGRKGRGLAR
jgi:hypothetical protein